MEEKDRDLAALQDFIVANAELEKLEAMLGQFNIFEAVGMERQEIRHSKFLAFLLDPNESHGMGDVFVKCFLQRVLTASPNAPTSFTPVELDLWDFEGMEVCREWQWIDIFLIDKRNRLAVIIENKIWSGEHSDQLSRYYEAVKEKYPEHKIFALYLTPHGDEPSHPEYLPVDYRMICETLDEIAESRASVAEPDAQVLIRHYTEMLRRHIMGDSEIVRLSREIYEKHSRAIDLIWQYRTGQNQFDFKAQHKSIIEDLIREYLDLDQDLTRKDNIKFGVKEWDTPTLLTARGWTSSKRILMFVVYNERDSLRLVLSIGPGPEEVRRKLFEIVANNEVFVSPRNQSSKAIRARTWPEIFTRHLLTPDFYQEDMSEEREAEIRKNWDDFLENDLPRIDAALKNEAWIWDSGESETPSRRGDEFTWGEGDAQILNRSDDELREGEE